MSRKWNFDRDSKTMAIELSEGHPGAMFTARSLLDLMPDEQALRVLLTQMAAMRMYGILLYYTFDVCGKDFQALINRVCAMDTALVDAVNKRLDAERVDPEQRLVYEGYIDWPSKLPDPKTIRQLGQILS